MHDVVAFRREWFVAAAMRAIREPPSVGARSIIARATALDNMRRVVEGCARVAVWSRSRRLGSLFWIWIWISTRQTDSRALRVETDAERTGDDTNDA